MHQKDCINAIMTTVSIAKSNNHGKKWTGSEDEHITDAPELTDCHFAQLLKRSEQAVHSRRAVLAAKLHRSSGRSIQECADQLHADIGRTTQAVNNDGRGMQKPPSTKTYTATFSSRNNSNTPKLFKPHQPSPTPELSNIAAICSHIKRNGANMDWIWTQDALVPTMVQYHQGFRAYAFFISTQGCEQLS
jgi:hypothetical protein